MLMHKIHNNNILILGLHYAQDPQYSNFGFAFADRYEKIINVINDIHIVEIRFVQCYLTERERETDIGSDTESETDTENKNVNVKNNW